MSFLPYVTKSQINDYTREELYDVCYTLELEYRGGHLSLDTDNIVSLVSTTSSPKLSRFSIHTNIVGPIIDKENTTYINPPTRTFTTKSGGQISKKLQDHITNLYEQMQFDLFMAKAEKFTSLQGMTLFKPTFDSEDDTMNILELYPSKGTLDLKKNPKFPSKVMEIEYKYKVGKIEHTIVIDKDKATDKWVDEDNKPHIETINHDFGVLPYAILKFKIDNSRVYGPPDFELYSLCKHRSLVLANAMARLHISDLEKLSVMGATPEEVLSNMRQRLLALPPQDDGTGTGNKILPTAEFISPDGQEALTLLDAYFKLYQHIMDNRGHVQKIFSRGADVPSAESIRLGSVDLYNKQQEKKKFLTIYEQDLWIRIIKENNRFNDTKIPEDIQLAVNFKPEPYAFANGSDEVTYFQSAIINKIETPVSWIRNRNPELTDEEALQLYEKNKKFFEDEIEDEIVEEQPQDDPDPDAIDNENKEDENKED